MSRRLRRVALLGMGLTLLAGCGSNNFRDLENVPSRNPGYAVVYNNVDGHPNIAQLCIAGLGFATTTRDYNAAFRVPEWDKFCATKP